MESSFQMLQNGHLKCLIWNLYEEIMSHQIFIKLFIKEFFLGDNFKDQINFDWDIWNEILNFFLKDYKINSSNGQSKMLLRKLWIFKFS
jgi:hypothetical protein